ncbi:MAG TPA: LysM peptidoglycan-binding domain-containing protein [Tepidisphaeraceae bacterium]|nr:LysM peptidoglycan-binding domain-containing protein [Tepidisphaeraceae bacterium]
MRLGTAVLAGVLVAAGCQTQPPPAARGSSPAVLDVTAPAPPHTPSVYAAGYAPAVTPASYSPAIPEYLPPAQPSEYGPAPAVTAQPPVSPAPDAQPAPAPKKSARAVYVVKHGDTLYHIAREKYGDGKKWQRIAEANPGVTPTTLKVGQKLVVP